MVNVIKWANAQAQAIYKKKKTCTKVDFITKIPTSSSNSEALDEKSWKMA